MKGRWALLVNGLLALAIVGTISACGSDDDDDSAAGSGGSAGSAGSAGSTSGSGGSTAGSGGSTAGSGGSMAMVTPEMCVANSMKETVTPMACLTCVCGKNASVIDKVGMAGWKLIECIGDKCDGDGTATMCITTNCMAEVTAGVMEATPTSSVFPMCKMECGIGDMMMMPTDDGGTPTGDAGL